jgi:hypothetical protein
LSAIPGELRKPVESPAFQATNPEKAAPTALAMGTATRRIPLPLEGHSSVVGLTLRF